MDRREIIRDMKSYAGAAFITAPAIAKYLGKNKDYGYRIVKGLDKIPGEKRGARYFIPDVVDRLMEIRR